MLKLTATAGVVFAAARYPGDHAPVSSVQSARVAQGVVVPGRFAPGAVRAVCFTPQAEEPGVKVVGLRSGLDRGPAGAAGGGVFHVNDRHGALLSHVVRDMFAQFVQFYEDGHQFTAALLVLFLCLKEGQVVTE